jgi:demethylmenaquinone methyltransferase/2-methoxy-6-polyprenyl-1,4-benzoquinol methylase
MIVGEPMRAYYDRRAPEYDEWWLGTGPWARRERPGWDEDREELVGMVASLPPARVLDVACGTGFLTRHLRGEVVTLDQSPEMVGIAARRVPGARVLLGEAMPLPFEDGAFDRVFTGHFYGHLLAREREAFRREARRVAPEVVVVDSFPREGGEREEWQERRLRDRSRYRVYKRFFTGEELAAELGGARVLHDGPWFVAVVSGGGPPRPTSTAPPRGRRDR